MRNEADTFRLIKGNNLNYDDEEKEEEDGDWNY
jgi:hypothetical protein